MSDDRILDDAELDKVSGGIDRLLMPAVIGAINKVCGTNYPTSPIDPAPAPCHPK